MRMLEGCFLRLDALGNGVARLIQTSIYMCVCMYVCMCLFPSVGFLNQILILFDIYNMNTDMILQVSK
jgi:hypothetical protein